MKSKPASDSIWESLAAPIYQQMDEPREWSWFLKHNRLHYRPISEDELREILAWLSFNNLIDSEYISETIQIKLWFRTKEEDRDSRSNILAERLLRLGNRRSGSGESGGSSDSSSGGVESDIAARRNQRLEEAFTRQERELVQTDCPTVLGIQDSSRAAK